MFLRLWWMAEESKMENMDLILDPERVKNKKMWGDTGIYVRVYDVEDKKWTSADIVLLHRDSLLRWLKSRGGDNPWAEDVVGILLGHGHLHDLGKDNAKI